MFSVRSVTSDWSPNDAFLYISTIVVSLFIFNSVQVKLQHVLALTISILVILFLSEQKQDSIVDFNSQMEVKLKSLLKNEDSSIVNFLHMDVDLINLFDSIKYDFSVYNRHAYIQAIKATNNILRIRHNMEQVLCSGVTDVDTRELKPWEDLRYHGHGSGRVKTTKDYCIKKYNVEYLEVAEQQMKSALNHLHSFIISIPSSKVFHDKHQSVMDKAQVLLKRNLDIIKHICDKQLTDKQVNHRTKFITDYDLPKAANKVIPDIAPSFNFY